MSILRPVRYVPTVLVTASYALAVALGHDPLRHVNASTRSVAYQTLSGVSGALLGFGLTAFAVFFAVAPDTRIAMVIALQGARLRVFLTTALATLASGSVGFAVLVPFDAGVTPNGWRYVAVALFGLSATAIAELVWLADRLFRTLSVDLRTERRSDVAGVDRPHDPWGPEVISSSTYDVPARPLRAR